MRFHRDTIKNLNGHPMSGIWMLTFESGRTVPIESGSGMRTLAGVFGASEGSGDLYDKIVGQEIVWYYDDMGLVFGGFLPVDEWDGADDFGDDGIMDWDPEADAEADAAETQ